MFWTYCFDLIYRSECNIRGVFNKFPENLHTIFKNIPTTLTFFLVYKHTINGLYTKYFVRCRSNVEVMVTMETHGWV